MRELGGSCVEVVVVCVCWGGGEGNIWERDGGRVTRETAVEDACVCVTYKMSISSGSCPAEGVLLWLLRNHSPQTLQ